MRTSILSNKNPQYGIPPHKTKKALILSGVHGNELTSIYCSYMLEKLELNSDTISSITSISNINKNGIINNTRDVPSTFTNDLNRAFENDIKISNLRDHIKDSIDRRDIIIDIHTSPNCAEFVLLNQDENTNSYVDFCKKHDIPYAIRYSDAPTIKKFCLNKNKVVFTLELNALNYIDYNSAYEGVNIITKIIENIEDFKLEKQEPIHPEFIELKTHRSGLFIPSNSSGNIISYNQYMGDILDLETFEKYKVYNKHEGKYRIIAFGSSAYVNPSNSICILQKV